jgi:hypothetical protein
METVPPGSYLALSHPAKDLNAAMRTQMSEQVNAMMANPVTLRDHEQVMRFFDGLAPVPPAWCACPSGGPAAS